MLKTLWERWKIVARKIADVQARFLLSAFYFVGISPFALGMKAFSDPLRLRPRTVTGWDERSVAEGDARITARRQF